MDMDDQDLPSVASDDDADQLDSSPLNPIVAAYLKGKLPAQAGDPGFVGPVAPGAVSDEVDSAQSAPGAPGAPALNPLVASYLASKHDLGVAQAASNQNQLYANLARAAGTFSHALSKSTQPMDESGYKALDQTAQAPVQNVEAQQAASMNDIKAQQTQLALKKAIAEADPSSPRAQLYQKLLQRMNPKLFQGTDLSQMTPADAEGMGKLVEADEGRQTRLQTAALAHEAKVNQQENSAMQNTQGILESTRGSPAVAQAEKDIYAAQKASTLMNLYGDPNKLNPQMAKLVVGEIGKIANGGQASEAELNAISPSTLHGALAGAWQRVSGDPTPANLGAFLKQYQDYANQITKDAQSVIQDRYGRVIAARSQQLGPQNTKALQDQYLGRFTHDQPIHLGQSAPSPTGAPTPQTIKQYSQSRNQTRISTDGGQTWQVVDGKQ